MRRSSRLAAITLAGILIGMANNPGAQAQVSDRAVGAGPGGPASPPAPPAATQAIDAPPVDHLLGDWGGIQPTLSAMGINLQIEGISEFAGNVSGGTRHGATFANQIGIDNDINWERLAGITGLSTHVIMVNRTGSSDSRQFGDNLMPVQEIYGSGGDVAVHLVSVYAQETLLDKRLDIAAGRMNVENDFASSPLYCGFMNNGLCGDPKALPGGDIGHSAYPDAVWAARIKVRPTEQTYVTTGLYEVNQGLYSDANFRTGFKFDTSQDSGFYLPIELGWEPLLGASKLPGHYKLGFGYDTSSGYKDFGNVLAAASVPGYQTKTRGGNSQFWALADQMLVRNGDGDKNGIIALAGLVENDGNNTQYQSQYFLGLLDSGFWAARPDDAIGLLATYVKISGRLADVEAAEQAAGLPLSNEATGVQSHEMVLEANYDIHVVPGLNFQPDFQYVIRPNAQSNIPNATVFGFRARVEF
jgi:porin